MTEPAKPAWKRPENWVTYGVLAILGFAALPYLADAMTYIRTILEQGIIGLVYLVGIAAIVAVGMSQDFHKLIWLAFKSSMKWMTNRVYRIFPIEIMQDYIAELKRKKEDLKESIGKLEGQLQKNTDKIEAKKKEWKQAAARAKQADGMRDKAGMSMEFTLQARRMGRLEKSGMTYQSLINSLKRLVAMMKKVLEATTFMIDDLEDTVEDEKEKRQAAQETFKAMQAARVILANDARRADFDAALEANNEDYFEKMGLVEQFSEETQSVFNTLDLDNGIYDADALEKLENLGKQVNEKLMQGGSGKTKYRIDHTIPAFEHNGEEAFSQFDEQQTEEPQAKRQSYADLFDK